MQTLGGAGCAASSRTAAADDWRIICRRRTSTCFLRHLLPLFGSALSSTVTTATFSRGVPSTSTSEIRSTVHGSSTALSDVVAFFADDNDARVSSQGEQVGSDVFAAGAASAMHVLHILYLLCV